MEIFKKLSPFSRIKQGLSKTRHQIFSKLGQMLSGKKSIDAALLEQIESLLLQGDVGVSVTESMMTQLQEEIQAHKLENGEQVWVYLQRNLQAILAPYEKPLVIDAHRPYVILAVGVNGAGKTTTLGKLALQFKQQGYRCLFAAGDTFRAASVEQLEVWGERNQIPVISQKIGSDSAAVIFDAMQSAKAQGIDIVLADTAGRLHTKQHLMEELKKVIRVIKKFDETAPHEILLVIDGSVGQNALSQARQFHEAVGLTGITLTKLDGTAKGGMIFALTEALHLPIRYIGVGEGIEDLKIFESRAFVEALFGDLSSETS